LASLLLIGGLMLGVFALNAYHFTQGQGGVPLDDSWIHFQFARNIARSDGFAFNPGQPTAGSTAPLWTLLLAGVYFAGGRFPLAGQILSAACFLGLLVAAHALARRLTGRRWAAWLGGAIVALNGRMVWAGLSALETCLFAALSLLALNAHLTDLAENRYRLRTATLFGLAALTRPEGYLLFALAMADLTLYVIRNNNKRFVLRNLLPSVLLFAAIVSPYLIFSLRTSGHLLPNTFHAKATFNFLPGLDFLSLWARYLILDNPLLLPFYILGVGALFRRASLLSLWSVGLPLVYSFMHVTLYQHGRYLIPLIPCNAIIGVVGLLEAGQLALTPGPSPQGRGECAFPLPKGERDRVRGILLPILLLIAGTAWRLPTMARLYAWNVDNINQMHVAIGHWVEENTPPDATLALNDIGAITYISERPIIDLAGLVTPEVIPLLEGSDRADNLAALLAERGVEYVIIFPNWFPDLAAHRDLLEPVHRVDLERNTIAGGESMVVYRARW
jgi:hypothetical protein